MRQFVSSEITIASEDFSALIALIRFVVGVSKQVGLEVGPLVKAATANGAFVRGLLHVQDLVDGQSPRLAKAFAAFGALERLLLRMDVSVVSKVILPTEGLSAQVT